jgi:FkbM family methyltransferase
MHFCSSCGKQVDDGTPFCSNCGARQTIGESPSRTSRDDERGTQQPPVATPSLPRCSVPFDRTAPVPMNPIALLMRRIHRFVTLWWRTGSLSLTMIAARHHSTVPALSVLDRGADLRKQADAVVFVYRSAAFTLPSATMVNLSVIADMLDTGYSFVQLDNDSWRLDTSDDLHFIIHTRSMTSDLGVMKHRFLEREYDFLDVDGCIVLDIGANIGDSAAFFALRGAKAVYSFEPFHATYLQAKTNIELSNLADRVQVLNVGISFRQEERLAAYEPSASIGLTTLPEARHKVIGLERSNARIERVKMISLSQAIEMCQIDAGDRVVCKMDCEGSEFEIFCQGVDVLPDLRMFERILVEYHWYSPAPLIEVLHSAGFETEVKTGGDFGHVLAVRT